MDRIEQAYRWKTLYWQAIEDGYEAWDAEQFANRSLSRELRTTVNLTRNSWLFGPSAGASA